MARRSRRRGRPHVRDLCLERGRDDLLPACFRDPLDGQRQRLPGFRRGDWLARRSRRRRRGLGCDPAEVDARSVRRPGAVRGAPRRYRFAARPARARGVVCPRAIGLDRLRRRNPEFVERPHVVRKQPLIAQSRHVRCAESALGARGRTRDLGSRRRGCAGRLRVLGAAADGLAGRAHLGRGGPTVDPEFDLVPLPRDAAAAGGVCLASCRPTAARRSAGRRRDDHVRSGGDTGDRSRCRADDRLLIGRCLAAQDRTGVSAVSARLSAGVPSGVRDYFAQPGRRRLILFTLSAVGYGFGLAAMVLAIAHDGGLGFDSQAYWMAGQNVLHGQPLYGSVAVDAFGAYKYPPIFAQLIAPLTLLPPLAFSWLWRIACFLCVRWLAGSWLNVGLWLLVPLTVIELSLGNVTFMVAAATVLAMRNQGWLTVPMAALKLGPIFVAPYLWLVNPQQRRSLVVGALVFATACGFSCAFNPTAWTDYLDSLLRSTTAAMSGAGVIALWPTGAVDLALRLLIAGGLTFVALRRRSERWVFTATVIAVPVLALSRFAPLLVLPRLGRTPTVTSTAAA